MNNILQDFTQYIQQIGYQKSSQYQIPHCIKEFVSVVNKSLCSITQNDILNFYEYLQTRPLRRRSGALSEAMIGHYIFSLKVFFRWLEHTQQIRYNPISSLKFKRAKGCPREPLSQAEINELFENTTTAKETAILHLFYSCGLRRTEAENLNSRDIHFSKNMLYVRVGKGAKRRVIPINEKVKIALEYYYIQERSSMHQDAYMLNNNNERMRGDSYNNALKTILKRTEIERTISLHHLRHSIATHLLENGLSIEFVRDFLGHKQLESTQIYAKVKALQLKDL